jgi:hypothetical protein
VTRLAGRVHRAFTRACDAGPVRRRRPSFAGIAVVVYVAVVVVVALLPSIGGITHRTLVASLAFSPSDLASGRLWLLPLSGVVVDGPTWGQLALLAEAAVALVVVAGARTFWRAAILAHAGSTLAAYAVLEVLDAADPSITGDLFRDPDYGVSCVWAGAVGALAVVGARAWPNARAKVAIAATVGAPLAALLAAGFVTPAGTLDIASVEHLFAFPLGALAGWMTPRPGRSATHRLSQPSLTSLSPARRTVSGPSPERTRP